MSEICDKNNQSKLIDNFMTLSQALNGILGFLKGLLIKIVVTKSRIALQNSANSTILHENF